MPLRAIIKANPEQVSDFLLAADDRYADAEELLVLQRFDAAVYLFGYAAEMWLKVACLRLRGVGPAAPVKSSLTALKVWMAASAPHVPFTDYHDLSFLAECVSALRGSVGRPFPATLASEFTSHVVVGLHAEWVVDMRYRRLGLTATDAWTVMNDAWWVKANWLALT